MFKLLIAGVVGVLLYESARIRLAEVAVLTLRTRIRDDATGGRLEAQLLLPALPYASVVARRAVLDYLPTLIGPKQ